MPEDLSRKTLITRNFAIRPDQKSMLIEFAKKEDRSVSGALRFIMDRWLYLEKLAAEASTPQAEPA